MPEQQTLTAASPSRIRPSVECRIHERQTCELPTSCHSAAAWGKQDRRRPATIRNVSVGGICLIVSRRFEPGVGLAIELPGTDGQEAYAVLAKVIRIKADDDGSWILGCRFISELSHEELRRLLPPGHIDLVAPKTPTPPEPPPIAPSRKAAVADGSESKPLVEVSVQIETPAGTALNCLIKRMRVPASWPLAAGKVMGLHACNAKGPLPRLRVQVIECVPQETRWLLRCRLLNPLSPELVQALGVPNPPVSKGIVTSEPST